MIITCDECNSSFSVGDNLIKESGSKVRCSKCDSVFVAYPQVIEDIAEPETGEDELGLDGLDSDLSDFLEDEEDQNLAMSTDTDDAPGDTEGELELDLDFDQDAAPDLIKDDESIAGDGLPELEELDSLDEVQPIADKVESDPEDLEFELDSKTDSELKLEGEDQLDLSDLELSLDEDTPPANTAETSSNDLEFDLVSEEDGVADVAEADLEIETTDELDFSDLDFEIEGALEAAQGSEAGEAEAKDLDLDLNLDLEDETVAGSEERGTDELDLSDLTDIIEDKKAPVAEAQPEELDLDLEIESDDKEPAAVVDPGDIDELDLSDLEGIMETGETTTAAEDSVQDLDMDLDLQMEENTPQTESAEAAAVSQDNDELDFSDLENMLESDETPSVETAEDEDSQELDLQFNLDEPGDGGSGEETTGDTVSETQDDDFLDIEQLLEDGEEDSSPESVEMDGDVTALPLEMEAALDDASKGADAELELDFDLESELQAKENLIEAGNTDDQLESDLLGSDEVDFLDEDGVEQSEFQDEGATSVVAADDSDPNDMAESDSAYGETQALPGPGGGQPIMEAEDEMLMEQAPKASRSKKPVLVGVLVFLLAVGVLIIPNMLGIKIPYVSDINIPYLSELDIKIPYLSDWLNPKPQDVAGNLKILPLENTINGNFVDNSKSGQLFVIKGHIKNVYDHPRSYIKVTGKIYLKDKKMAKKATVYCGNMLSNSELASMDMAAINKKLSFRSGDKRSNFKVSTGKKVPFMIVFDKLPNNLDEYTVEVEGSTI